MTRYRMGYEKEQSEEDKRKGIRRFVMTEESFEVELSKEDQLEAERGFMFRKMTENSTVSDSEEFAFLLQEIAKDMEATKDWRDRVAQTVESVNEIFEKSERKRSAVCTASLINEHTALAKLHVYLYRKAYIKVSSEYLDIEKVTRVINPCDMVYERVTKVINPCDIVYNRCASSMEDAERITHILYLTKEEIMDKQKSGVYNNVDLPYLQHAKEEDKFPIYEVYIYGNGNFSPGDKEDYPFVLVIDQTTKQILAVKKNWIDDINLLDGGKRIDYFDYFANFDHDPSFDDWEEVRNA